MYTTSGGVIQIEKGESTVNGDTILSFTDEWMWLIFVGIGLLLVILELLIGLDTGLDLVFIGTAFVIGGLITWPIHAWIATILITAAICVIYVFLGRKYIHRKTAVPLERTNVDAVIGKSGIVIKEIEKNTVGRVKVGNEQWRAQAEETIKEGDEIIVTRVTGATLSVRKSEGGSL
jgi:membrane protein implicated in regulation of membrane protease activity